MEKPCQNILTAWANHQGTSQLQKLPQPHLIHSLVFSCPDLIGDSKTPSSHIKGRSSEPPTFMPHSLCAVGPGASAPSLLCRAAQARVYFLRVKLERLWKQV